MNEVEQAQQVIIDEFGFFDDWMDRYPVSYTHLTLPTKA